MEIDERFLTAMEYGMPPMTGFGMGIDRLVAIFTEQKNLRDVIFFPIMRKKKTKNKNPRAFGAGVYHSSTGKTFPVSVTISLPGKPPTRKMILPFLSKVIIPGPMVGMFSFMGFIFYHNTNFSIMRQIIF